MQLVLVGAALFGLVQVVTPRLDGPAAERTQRIELSTADLRAISGSWLAQGRAAPTDEEMRHLIELRVREEILAREARALGLDDRDEIVRLRLAQKMEFLLGDAAALDEPSADELRAWFAANGARFAEPARMSFQQVYFSPGRRGARARDDAVRARDSLAASGAEAAQAAAPGDPTLVAPACVDCSSEEIAAQLGAPFAAELMRVPLGAWSGPLESSYGWHVVRVDAHTPARVPSLEEVEAAVRAAWTAEREAELRQKAYEAIRARYEVVLPAKTGAEGAGTEVEQ